MGQRLVIGIKKGGEEVANAYYHWSGYTFSAIDIIKDILRTYYSLDEDMKFVNDVDLALYLLNVTGAGLSPESFDYVRTTYPDITRTTQLINRNEGIIHITADERAMAWSYSEADVEIDLDQDKIFFGACFYVADDLDNFYEYLTNGDWHSEEEAKEMMNNVVDVCCTPACPMSFDDFFMFVEDMQNVDNFYFRAPDGEIWGTIE